MDEARRTFQPSRQILDAVQQAQGNQIQQRAGQAGQQFEQSVRDIARQQQQRGVDFQGFSQGESERILGPGRSDIQTGQATADMSELQLANTLAELVGTQRETGASMEDTQQERAQEREMTEQELQLDEEIARQSAQTTVDTARQQAAQQAAEDERDRRAGKIEAFLESMAGDDGYVSPQAYANARMRWNQLGGDSVDFDREFMSDYTNPEYRQDYTTEGFADVVAYDVRREGNRPASYPEPQQNQTPDAGWGEQAWDWISGVFE